MLNTQLIEREFGAFSPIIHVNTCMIGLLPRRTCEASDGFARDHNDVALMTGRLSNEDTRAAVRAQLAQLIGASPEEIAFTRSTTEGLSILAMGYPLGPGDRVICCDLENPSNLYPWFNAAEQRQYQVDIIQTDGSRLTIADIEAALTKKPAAKVVALSAVQAGTGYFFDIKQAAQLCHRAGAILVVDGIQCIGRMDVKVRELGIDVLSCGGYKGLLSGFGTGFLYVRSDLIQTVLPPYAGPTAATAFASPPAVTASADIFRLSPTATRFESGSHNAYGITVMKASLSLLLELGLPEIQAHVLALEQQLRDALADVPVQWLGADTPDRRSGVVVCLYPEQEYERVKGLLAEHHILLTHRPGYLRMCLSFYQTPQQVDVIAQVLRAVVLG